MLFAFLPVSDSFVFIHVVCKKKESKENEQQTEKDRSQQIDVLNIETQPTDQKKTLHALHNFV